MNPVGATTGGVLTIGTDGSAVDWIQSRRDGLPLQPGQEADRVGLACTLVDPQFQETKLYRGQRHGLGGISCGRHEGLAAMGSHLEQQTVCAVAWNDQWFFPITGENQLPVFQNHVPESQALAVAGQAFGLKNRKEILVEGYRFRSFRDHDGNRSVPLRILFLVEFSLD